MDVGELFDTVVGFVALAAVLGIALLIPLYLSQRRDVIRLRRLMELEPDFTSRNLSASEARLDHAETDLERVLGETVVATSEPSPTPGELPAATRVTHERPALERVTMERAALAPHPRWRRFVSRATQPRVLVAIGLVALLLGAGTIVASQALLSDDSAPGGHRAGAIDPGDVKVAVLNGTSLDGLAGKVASDVTASGYKVVAVTNTDPGVTQTEVLFARHQKPAAQKLAKDLGVKKVKPLDEVSRERAGRADVVVIAGEDRA